MEKTLFCYCQSQSWFRQCVYTDQVRLCLTLIMPSGNGTEGRENSVTVHLAAFCATTAQLLGKVRMPNVFQLAGGRDICSIDSYRVTPSPQKDWTPSGLTIFKV
jgi:hypothetical protein